MTLKTISAAVALSAAIAASPALAQDPVKIGLITTLSGPAGYLGNQILDGFKLAVEDGKLGGVPVEIVAEDDGFKPANGRQIADKMLHDEDISCSPASCSPTSPARPCRTFSTPGPST